MTPDENDTHADTEQLLRRLAAQEHELRMSDEQTERLLVSIESGYRRHKRYRIYSRALQSAAALVLLAVAGAAYTLHHEELEQLATDARSQEMPPWCLPAPVDTYEAECEEECCDEAGSSTPAAGAVAQPIAMAGNVRSGSSAWDCAPPIPESIHDTTQVATVVPKAKLSKKKKMEKCQSQLQDYRKLALLLSRPEPDLAELRRMLSTGKPLYIPTDKGGLTVCLRQDGCVEIIPQQAAATHLLKAQGDSLPEELRRQLKITAER